MRTEYTKTENFTILGVSENNKLTHFVVADRNNELISDKKFTIASEAIDWADRFYKGLIDD